MSHYRYSIESLVHSVQRATGVFSSGLTGAINAGRSLTQVMVEEPPVKRTKSLEEKDSVIIRDVGDILDSDGGKPIDAYLYLRRKQRNQPEAFYNGLIHHCQELLPYLYTPTVGEACQRYHTLNIPTYGVYLRADHCITKDCMLSQLKSLSPKFYDVDNIKVVVVTDGERILGLGDLGVGGMGISEGKSLLYTAAAGVPPKQVLPICLDVGTNNKSLLEDEEYFGMRWERLRGCEYHDFMNQFILALKEWNPNVVLQFEDFANHNAFELLQQYRKEICCFNDDIQGTASIALSGLLAALRLTKKSLVEQRILFLGAGEAGVGIGDLIAKALQTWHRLSLEEARKHCYFIDSKGLINSDRKNLQDHKKNFAHDVPACRSLVESIKAIKPTALIGVSTQPGSFTKEALELMAEINERPIVFPLSNPTSKSECTFEQAFTHTRGRVVFASGSPFSPIESGGKMHSPAQSNNAYIFPALGYAASLCNATEITDEAFLIAAKALSEMATIDELESGALFPKFSNIRNVSRHLMGVIASYMCSEGLGRLPADFEEKTKHVEGDIRKWETYSAMHMYSASAKL